MTDSRQMDADRKDERDEVPVRRSIIAVGIIGLLLTVLPLALYLVRFHGPLSQDQDAFASFGAYLGGAAGPMLSFLALIALLMTIDVQLKELRATRTELRKSAEALDAQKRAMQRQLFDSAFFEELRLLNDIVNSMRLDDGGSTEKTGRACFVTFEETLRDVYSTNLARGFAVAYSDIYSLYQAHLGHYFRTLYNIVRFIDERGPSDKRFYIRLVRAQLSDSELAILFYNGLSERGEKFRTLIEKYALLDTLSDDHVLDVNHKRQYTAGAFSSTTAWTLMSVSGTERSSETP